ncbi:MAG TPA: hypothetical protein VGS20_08765 [Candidatus Acidoferrales bacterium]|nr:hypothetical protein [Candidatus Acidoferrales bacterium]
MSDEVAGAGIVGACLALKSSRKLIRIQEYFGGLYLVARDALLPYWFETTRLDAFARRACGLREPVWFYWIDAYNTMHTVLADGVLIGFSRDLAELLDHAARLALEAERKKDGQGRPELGVKHLMMALARHPNWKFTRGLVRSGFSLERL